MPMVAISGGYKHGTYTTGVVLMREIPPSSPSLNLL